MTLRTIMPSSVMKPSTDVRPMVKSAIRSPTTAPNRHSDIEAMTTSVMPNLRKLTRMKKKMITSEIDSPDAMGGMVSQSNSWAPPSSVVTPAGSTSSRSMMSLIREVIRMALAPRLRSAVTVMQRMPLRCTILLWLQTGSTSAIWRRGTLTEGTGDEM